MKANGKLMRLARTISLISYKRRTREEIIEMLNEDSYYVSYRTFDRLIRDIRDMGFEVSYVKHYGYLIENFEYNSIYRPVIRGLKDSVPSASEQNTTYRINRLFQNNLRR